MRAASRLHDCMSGPENHAPLHGHGEENMNWNSALDPDCPICDAVDSVDTVIVPPTWDLGGF